VVRAPGAVPKGPRFKLWSGHLFSRQFLVNFSDFTYYIVQVYYLIRIVYTCLHRLILSLEFNDGLMLFVH